MSGLAALFHRDGRPADGAAIWAMLAAVPHRGPDGARVRLCDSVGLGHAKMVVTAEEESEQQPLISPRTACALIADARLDNRGELLARLPDRPSPTSSDADLILRAYEAWGPDGVADLLGDFAFVLWDPRHRRVVCARDTGGQRTLFYRVDPRTFAAASEIHQLLQDPSVVIEPNDERIRNFLVPLNMFRNEKDQAATFYAGIMAVPAGHFVVADPEGLRVQKYWELEPPAELRYRSDDEYAEHYLSLFSEVVRDRLRSSRPIGALLSGGLDSSSMVCTAQELYRAGRAEDHGFTSFSFVYDDPSCDERDFIRDVQAKYGFSARYLPPHPAIKRLRPEPTAFEESPTSAPIELAETLALASRDGVRVLLTGEWADSCIGGSWQVFDSMLRRLEFERCWRHVLGYRRESGERLRKILALYCLGPLLPLGAQRWLMSAYARRVVGRRGRDLVPVWMPEPLRDELVRRHLALWLEQEQGRRFASPSRQDEFNLLYPPEVTRNWSTQPLEFRRPFADRRLHQFLLAIPPEQKFNPSPDGWYASTKWLVRRAMRGILPESIRTRTSKTVFDALFLGELEREWPTYEAVFGPAARPRIAARGYVDQDLFWRRLNHLRACGCRGDFMYVLRMVGLETWLRTFDLPRPRPTEIPSPWGAHAPFSDQVRHAALAPVMSRE